MRNLGLVVSLTLSAGLAAQQPPVGDSLNNLTFRWLGPPVAGGRIAAVVGIPGQPGTYYVGAAAGGVWKTVDGGNNWTAIFRDQPTASIGALALAPTNPNLVWVGTGEGAIRNDIINGHGVYMSPDAGKSWRLAGLPEVGQISRIVIDPENSDIVFVAAVGHAWTPGPDRGVYRTADGGKTWQKVLFVNDTTGCADLVMEPGNPAVLFAAMWQVERHPWQLVSGGPGSGIYRSTDGGLTWTKLTEGLPDGPFGRIALGIGASNPTHVYALIEAKRGLLWDSHDLGDHWTSVSDWHGLDVRPFYFSVITVAPNDDRHVFFSSFELRESLDGGKTSRLADRGVHVDHHALWIDPKDPDRMIQGNDGGVYVAADGGKSWTYLNNLPIEQFYMVAADANDPYTLCGGLQDNNAWCGPSSNGGPEQEHGGGWSAVTGGDGEYAVPAPSDSSILYVDSQNGYIVRFDRRRSVRRFVRPYMSGVEDAPASELTYRFNWTSPIAVSATNADEVLLGANVLFKSTDGGQHWKAISPDLTRNDKAKQVTSGGPIEYDISGAETYNTILTVNVAPTDTNVLWVGTDDGNVQVTRNGGRTWTNVAARVVGLPRGDGGRVNMIGVSPFDAGTAYLAFDYHEFDDNRPYVYKTTDYGETWTDIGRGLPASDPVRVVREDPNARGFLVLGTDAGLYYSPDAGVRWMALRDSLPTAPVWDVLFVARSHDLVVATHGLGLFLFDNLTPLEEKAAVSSADLHVFSLRPAYRRAGVRGLAPPASRFSAPNAPDGAIVDYYLRAELKASDEEKRAHKTPVAITVMDSVNDTVVTLYGPSKQGFNRFVWDLRYAAPERLTFEKPTEEEEDNEPPRGPPVTPGRYRVTVGASGHTEAQWVLVAPDPHLAVSAADFVAETRTRLEVRNAVSAEHALLNRLANLGDQLDHLREAVRTAGLDSAALKPVLTQADSLGKTLKGLKDSIYDPAEQRDAIEDDVHYLGRLHERLERLGFQSSYGYAEPPSDALLEDLKRVRGELDAELARFNTLIATDIAAFNDLAASHHLPTLVAGDALSVRAVR
ncbi:MAG TPA: hypothetical protein VN848_13555 [Gemmatimonadales bacterium]|nr:hypothetical protein [Gemmatimonadales bacterium]